jgi:uncharacterized protein (DUF2252 family)
VLLQEQDATREPDLVPVRHGRMLVSPFTFFRGGAKVMAADLQGTPTAGLDVQLCGDAHLSNFGLFASPERRLLLQGRDQDDPLFLQLKEATASVLEDHLPASRYRHHGQRVVSGQRMMQAASDIYLDWTEANIGTTHHFSWRQLRDMKGSPDVETMAPTTLTFYARACGWTLARAHARSADPIATPPTWADGTGSTGRSPTSPSVTPTRTSATTRRSSRRSGPAACRPSRASRKVCWILGAWTFR